MRGSSQITRFNALSVCLTAGWAGQAADARTLLRVSEWRGFENVA